MNVIKYNYDTKLFSTVELRLFSRQDNDRPKHNKKWNVVGGNVPQNLRNEFAQKRTKTWREFKEWCQSKNLTPDENSGGYGQNNNDNNNNNNNNNQNNYNNTNTAGPTRNEGTGIYNIGKIFDTEFKGGKMNARKYMNIRILKARLNELLKEGFIEDIFEDGNYNYGITIRKDKTTDKTGLEGGSFIYMGIYVIDDNNFGIVKWNLDNGGNVRKDVVNAVIAGPDKLRSTIKRLANEEKGFATRLKLAFKNSPATFLEFLGNCISESFNYFARKYREFIDD